MAWYWWLLAILVLSGFVAIYFAVAGAIAGILVRRLRWDSDDADTGGMLWPLLVPTYLAWKVGQGLVRKRKRAHTRRVRP